MPEQAATRRAWTRRELKLAFYVYCLLPFGKLHQSNPDVQRLASATGRTPGAAAMKLVNFASLDPTIRESGRRGLSNASRLDREVWEEFHSDWEGLAVESERQLGLTTRGHIRDAPTSQDAFEDHFSDLDDYTGETREALTRVRIGQSFFRRTVLSSFGNRCCMSGLSEPRLLVASHIKPWRDDKANRLNPRNGLCLSSIHDKAFDAGLITLDEELRVQLGRPLRLSTDALVADAFHPLQGQPVALPERFLPDPALLAYHRTVRFVDAAQQASTGRP